VLKTAPALTASLGDGRACLERAADALHCRWIDAEPFGNDPYAGPPRSRQSLADSFFQRRGYRRPAKAFSPVLDSRKPGTGSFCGPRPSIPPEISKAVGRQGRVAHGRGNRAVTEIMLDRPCVVPIIGELVAAGMSQHVGVDQERETRSLAGTGNRSICYKN
jgi:hypothetical protein